MDAVAEGDERAFAALYDCLAPAVVGVVRSVVADQVTSDDVVEEVFVELWRTAPQRPRGMGATAWVLRMARRRSVDRIRADRGGTGVAEERQAPRAPGEGRHGLDVLTGQERRAVVLACYGAWTRDEVAAELAVEAAVADSLLRRGLLRLGAELPEETPVVPRGHVGGG